MKKQDNTKTIEDLRKNLKTHDANTDKLKTANARAQEVGSSSDHPTSSDFNEQYPEQAEQVTKVGCCNSIFSCSIL